VRWGRGNLLRVPGEDSKSAGESSSPAIESPHHAVDPTHRESCQCQFQPEENDEQKVQVELGISKKKQSL
jgi:hypothetical protein